MRRRAKDTYSIERLAPQTELVVFDLRDDSLVVMDPSGRFARTTYPARTVSIGDSVYRYEVEPVTRTVATERATRSLNIGAIGAVGAVAAAIILALFLSLALWSQQGAAVAVISLDINPSLELAVDSEGKVSGVEALNEDASQLLEGLDLQGQPWAQAIEGLIAGAAAKGYLQGEEEDLVLASVVYLDAEAEAELSLGLPTPESVSETLTKEIEGLGITSWVVTMVADKARWQEAKEAGISVSKYAAAEGIEKALQGRGKGAAIGDIRSALAHSSVKDVVGGLDIPLRELLEKGLPAGTGPDGSRPLPIIVIPGGRDGKDNDPGWRPGHGEQGKDREEGDEEDESPGGGIDIELPPAANEGRGKGGPPVTVPGQLKGLIPVVPPIGADDDDTSPEAPGEPREEGGDEDSSEEELDGIDGVEEGPGGGGDEQEETTDETEDTGDLEGSGETTESPFEDGSNDSDETTASSDSTSEWSSKSDDETTTDTSTDTSTAASPTSSGETSDPTGTR